MKTTLTNEQLTYFANMTGEGLSISLFNEDNQFELQTLTAELMPDEQEILIGEEFVPVLRCNMRTNERFTMISIKKNNRYQNPLNN
jgi:hypothetical protein